MPGPSNNSPRASRHRPHGLVTSPPSPLNPAAFRPVAAGLRPAKSRPESSTARTPFEDRYLAEARRICLQEIPDPRYEIFLFSSRAQGSCEHSSDVDIGIVGPDPLAGGVSRLMDRLLESDVPWRCQVVDFGLVTDEAFRRQAYEGREVWRAAS